MHLKTPASESFWKTTEYSLDLNIPSYSVLRVMALTLRTSVEYLSENTDTDKPDALMVNTSALRMSYIIEAFTNYTEEGLLTAVLQMADSMDF